MVLNLQIRPFAPADAPAATALLNAIIRAGGTTALGTPLTAGRTTELFLEGPKVRCCHVALDDAGAMLGFQSVGRVPDLPADWGEMGTYVRVGLAGRGVGSALFTATKARAKALGLVTLNAKIRADNGGGLAYYQSRGFCDYGRLPAVPLDDGTLVDRVLKRLDL